MKGAERIHGSIDRLVTGLIEYAETSTAQSSDIGFFHAAD